MVHLAFVIRWVLHLNGSAEKLAGFSPIRRITTVLGGTFAIIVFSHTVQVWLWAASFIWLDALNEIDQAIYFSLVTYTTLGYGDITLTNEFNIFGAMASVTGLLNFGVSTAILVAVIGRMLQAQFGVE